MRVGILFGGSGYIGFFLTKSLLDQKLFDQIIIYDLQEPKAYLDTYDLSAVKYLKGDVRHPILGMGLSNIDGKNSWIFNLAAVHREPGHQYQEYFETNIKGARNINTFANQNGIRNIFFTSSIAPYGKSMDQRTEKSTLYPETAYGISKAMAELIHQNWLAEDTLRRLIIARPSVIFGPGDPGNVYRMISGLKKGTFVLPNGGKIIKAYGYVYGLVESVLFTMAKDERLILYNYAEDPIIPLNEMVKIAKKKFNYKRPTISLSVTVLTFVAAILQFFTKIVGRKTDIHPVRVRKAGFPTNIRPNYLIENGFTFKYDFESALEHWKNTKPNDF